MIPRDLTYGDFYRTGVQDCGNAIDLDEFDLESGGTAAQIVDRTWSEWEEDDLEGQWRRQQDDFEGLDPHRAYESWRSGWKDCATQLIKERLKERENPAKRRSGNPPRSWVRKPTPKRDQPCYPTKTAALKKFLDVNADIVQGYGGADYEVSPSEFDAINHKYGLTGKKAARTIADAVWIAMPVGRPYCLDRLDLEALNDTSPAREAGVSFRLPDVVYEAEMARKQVEYYRDMPEPAWVTEVELPRPVTAPTPSIHEVVPYHLEPEEQEPGVATYRMSIPQVMRPRLELVRTPPEAAPSPTLKPPAPRPEAAPWPQRAITVPRQKTAPLRPVTAPRPFRLELEEEEPGVAHYRIANPAGCECAAPKENPAWVTNILSRHFLELEENVPPQWLPKLTGAKAVRGKLHAAMKEYGCGYYGCVLPTLDDGVVLKLTTDVTEAEFARDVAGRLSAPVVVKYRLTRELPDKYKGRQAFLLWRDSADRVGEIAAVVDERGGNGEAAEELVAEQHRAAQEAFEALHDGRPAGKLMERWERAARKMGRVPELRELAEGMIRNLERGGVFMGDVHSGNLGRVDGRWVVVDPGHVAVLEDG